MQIQQRLRQLRSALSAQVTAEERAMLGRTLSPAEARLFARMPLFDQRHCLDVYHTLAQAGHNDPALLRAALLHDCGKVDDDGRPIPLLYYGIFVVLRRLAPRLYQRATLSRLRPLRPFGLHAAHEERAVALAEAAGSASEVLEILRDYATRRTTPLTAALHWADDLN
ncbi:MAG: hypothetical protein RLZZ387_57 [Chloroflexota bacterium]|jgi:hypothetical protein